MDALIALAGLLVGASLNEVQAWLRHRRDTIAARQAKDFDYQEQNLYHLQEALRQLAYLSNVLAERRDNADDRLRLTESITWSLVYSARASDTSIRSVADECVALALDFRDAVETEHAAEALEAMLTKVSTANELIGNELKQLRGQNPRR